MELRNKCMYFLESKRIGLRQLKEADIDGGYKDWLNDSVVCRYTYKI